MIRYDEIVKGRVYTFEYLLPWQNPMVNNDGVQSALVRRAGMYAEIIDVSGILNLRVTFRATISGGTVESWNRTLQTVLDEYVWGSTEFLKAESGEGSGYGIAPVIDAVKKTGIGLLAGIAILAVILFKVKE